jgi:prevent-host-death family protein
MASATLNGFDVFADEVYTSTDLNRRSGEVLNRAREGPVTISRNNEQFALLRREQAARLIRTANRTTNALILLSEAHSVLAGVDPSPSYNWLKILEKDDLKRLCSEVLVAVRTAAGCNNWDEVDATIHEWKESALVAQTGVLDAAMFVEKHEPSLLPDPAEIQDQKGELAASTAECLTAD